MTEVSEHTGFPEILDGRVKTLVPQIHGGLLGRRDLPEHMAQMAAHGIAPIDLLAVNLYPFEATVARGAAPDDCVENIDIGGPALIRAAAKNHDFVTVLTEPDQYAEVLAEIAAQGGTTLALRRRLAGAAYARTAAYDAAIAAWFAAERGEAFPPRLAIAGTLRQTLRYGENPHQQAAFYVSTATRAGVATATQVQGKELSYNNLNDTDAAYECVAEFDAPTVVIVKHANPCGVATAATPGRGVGGGAALRPDLGLRRRRGAEPDPGRADGGTDRRDLHRSHHRSGRRCRGARGAGAQEEPAAAAGRRAARSGRAGHRVPQRRRRVPGADARRRASGGGRSAGRHPARAEPDGARGPAVRVPRLQACEIERDRVCEGRRDGGHRRRADEPGRFRAHRGLESAEAAKAAGLDAPLAQGSVVASDAFFPFADGLEAAVAAGATAVIQPGGSMRDAEVIAAADAAGVAMVLTGMRHFRH